MSIDASVVANIVLSVSGNVSVGADELNENDPGQHVVTMDKTYTIKKSKGNTVADAKLISAAVSSQAITYNGQGQIAPGDQVLKFSVSKHNSTDAINWFVAPIGGAEIAAGTNLSASTGDAVTMTAKQFNTVRGQSDGVTVIAKLGDGKLVEKISVLALRSAAVNETATPDPNAKKPANAPTTVPTPPSTTTETANYLGLLTNEVHIVATDAKGDGGNFTDAGGTMRLFDGTSEVTTTRNIHYSVANVSEGLQISVDENTGVYKITGLSTDDGTAVIRATYDTDDVDGGGDIPDDGIAGSDAGGAAGSAGAGDAGADAESFTTCRAKYGLSDDEATAIQNEGSAHPFGTTPEGLARERAVNAGRDSDADPTDATSNDAKAAPIGCENCANASDTFKLSPRFTVYDLSIHCDASPTRIGNGSASLDPTTGRNRIYNRAEIICNLRHLCVNALEPIFAHFLPLGYTIQITSGYRRGRGDKSDHPKGSAADLRIYYKGQRIGGRHLTRVQMAIDQIVRVPYTQMIFETPSSSGDILHVACRRVGGRSGLRNCWSTGNGHGGSTRSGYKYKVGIDDGPPVR